MAEEAKSRREIPPTYIPLLGCPYHYYTNRHFWSEGYYVSTVGMNEATVKKHIEEQEKHDIAMDKLSVRKYENHFKGSKECERPLRGGKRGKASVLKRWPEFIGF